MKNTKRAKLRASGWSVGSAEDFLDLSAEEAALIELRISLSRSLKNLRTRRRLSQVELAKRLKSSQSRVAKMEAADPTVTVDLLVRSLFALGASPRDIARAIVQSKKAAAA
jgi:ribosome-binding protein aMBF1 (putative translation factor)